MTAEIGSKGILHSHQTESIDTQVRATTDHRIALTDYYDNVQQMNKRTAREYLKRLRSFSAYVQEKYGCIIDVLIRGLARGEVDPYGVLSGYVSFLNRQGTVSELSLKQRVVTAKNFLEYCDVEISPRRFKLKVRMPKVIRKNKEALTKEVITDILNACSDLRIRTYVHLLAATGLRANEALSTRVCDYRFNDSNDPSNLFISGKFTKTSADRVVFLTEEIVKQLKIWLEFKYRTRRVAYYDKANGKSRWEYRTPNRDDENDLMFSIGRSTKGYESVSASNLYDEFRTAFGNTLDRIHKGQREDSKLAGGRRKITLHSFRRFVKSTISDLGYADFSEFFIGHSGSTYYRKSEKEKAELFKKIEPYLTFLDLTTLQRKGADTQTRIEELEATNQMLRQKDSMNADAISGLSDQLSKVIQEIELLKGK